MAMKQVFILFLTVIATTLPLVAQDPEEPETTIRERLEVTEVLLDVVVTDGSGNIIIGLKPEDFVISDGDREVPAKTAVFYSNRRYVDSGLSAERLGLAEDDVVADRYFIFFFHDQRFEDPNLTGNILDAIRWSKRVGPVREPGQRLDRDPQLRCQPQSASGLHQQQGGSAARSRQRLQVEESGEHLAFPYRGDRRSQPASQPASGQGPSQADAPHLQRPVDRG